MYRTLLSLLALLLLTGGMCFITARDTGGRVEYVGGTIAQIPAGCQGHAQTLDEQFFVFYSRGASWRVPYESINLLEYGQNVNRRLAAAVFISPLFILSKARQHFLTVGYTDEQGKQQALIFRVNKGDIRLILATLEARTGRRIEFQDEEARKAGRG
jgi:hypothetical protein